MRRIGIGYGILVDHNEADGAACRVEGGPARCHRKRTGTHGVVAHLAEGSPEQRARPLCGHHQEDPWRNRGGRHNLQVESHSMTQQAAGTRGG